MKKDTKFKLDNDIIAEDFFQQTHLLGIVAPVKDYHFIWHVNNRMGYQFRLHTDIEMHLRKKNRDYYFPVYVHIAAGCSIGHYIYNNQNKGEFLLPEFKHLDYLWLIKGDEDDEIDIREVQQIQQSTRLFPFVQLVNELTNEKIKNKTHLVF